MSDLALDVYTCDVFDLPGGGQFSPTTSTLITGPTEAILVDTQFRAADVDEVIEQIEDSGKRLTTIFITHGHFDHYFGLERLLNRFPDARAVAVPAVAKEIAANLESDRAYVREFLGGLALDNAAVPEALDNLVLTIDGVELVAIEIEQADTAPTAILHIPTLQAVVAGDVVYNGVNPMLAMTERSDWPNWIAGVDRLASLNPTTVVAGHKRPELGDPADCIAETRDYLQEFVTKVDGLQSARELITHMQSRYPNHANPSTLVVSAVTAFKRKKAND
ncbi:MBL fold metallo-hydrolase [Nocardia rhizosphaerihabitans]|uniref:MBL fold metallo-hydrolase n=1 Tax=Nocardia rhizosphaerihabitans TaxID=1691570 RepID=A0ABQ2L4H4_9NOCA|nr:MBL fold metallo-hydrolase [Nocardia rhizosphaerihabitans]GGO00652.1 MBL fold metallo-hydrolase [Nocardia rhizosphaerihabitans]